MSAGRLLGAAVTSASLVASVCLAAPAGAVTAPAPTHAMAAASTVHALPVPAAVPTGVSPALAARVHTLSGALRVIRLCEASGNYRANTGNGYYGAYQFSAATWRRLGLRGLPHQARPAVQDAAAAKLHDRRGSWADWGSCGARASRVHT